MLLRENSATAMIVRQRECHLLQQVDHLLTGLGAQIVGHKQPLQEPGNITENYMHYI